MTPLNRISTWLNRSIGNRLTAASVATAFGLVTFLALAAFPIFFYQAWQNFSDSSDNAVRPIVDHIDLRLRVIEQNLGQLAKNSFVVNSLVDSTGKEIYLQPTLRDFRLPFDIASSLLIFDANLEPVGSNESASAFMMPEAKLLAGRALKEQKPRIAVREISGKNVLLVVFPIFYPPASTYEGALVGLLHPDDIVSLEDWPEQDGCAVIHAGTRPLLDTGCRFSSGVHTISREIRGDSQLGQDAPLSVTFGRPVTSLYLALARILFAYALVGALALVGAYLFSRRLGRDFSQQLDMLSKAALNIAEQPGALRCVEWNRPDEIGQFVDAFNNMVGSLQEMHATLERRVLERTDELVASQRDYASLAQAAPVGICRATPAGDCVYVNELWSQISGLSLAEALGKGWLRAIHPDDRDRVFKEWSASVRKQRPFSLEFRLQSTAGVTTWVFGQALAVTNDNGGVLGYVGTTTNISQRKRAEEATLRAEDRYRSVVENIKEVVFQTDEEGRWTLLNRAWTEITGFAIDETLGKNFLDCVHPDDRTHTLTLFQQLIERKRDFCRHENRYLHKAGGFRWIEVYARLTVDSEGRVRGTSGTLTDITDRHAAEEQLERIAHYDALTQLPNRILLADRMRHALAQAKRSSLLVGVCYLDLDGFKAVNDTYGHAAGDKLLVEVAQRLTRTLRAEDTVARLGGDEFVAIMSGLQSVEQCEQILQRTILSVSEPIFLSGSVVTVSASIGVAFYPDAGDDADTLLRQADHAMYEAKQAGKNRYQLFNPEQDKRVRSYRSRLKEIEQALERQEFSLYYQPKVHIGTGAVIGVEALLRWNHSSMGLLSPGQFLVDLNNADLESEIDRWVLHTALRQVEEWKQAGRLLPVSVNVSSAFLENPNFVTQIHAILDAHPLADRMLELEVLESVALDDVEHVAQVIHECHKLGVSFALDDFGTGYSSLTYFRRLPAETLKIDMSFVKDMLVDSDDLAIVKGVIGLTKAFGRKAVAEGVTTAAHFDALGSLGCDIAQGFGIAQPMRACELTEWMCKWENEHQPEGVGIS